MLSNAYPLLCMLFILNATLLSAQYDYEPSVEHPFGQANPEAPRAIKDFDLLIGECNCTSTNRGPDGEWNEPEQMVWRWKYIMNGLAVQDETLKADGGHSGSIRQYLEDEHGQGEWYVHYYSAKGPTATLPTWRGSKTEGGDIVLYREQAAPNGTEGFYRLTFHDISEKGYQWKGEWVSKDESIVYPSWRIVCERLE
ncbi:MAG: hypothetical protein AAF433_02155 [Bacteroidota bacterium]